MSWEFVAGFASPFLLFALLLAVMQGAERGKEIECRACGYSTGATNDTRRFTCWARWHWHKLTTGHHTRRWQRQHKLCACGHRVRAHLPSGGCLGVGIDTPPCPCPVGQQLTRLGPWRSVGRRADR